MESREWKTVITNESGEPIQGYYFNQNYEYLETTSLFTPENTKEFVAGVQLSITQDISNDM